MSNKNSAMVCIPFKHILKEYTPECLLSKFVYIKDNNFYIKFEDFFAFCNNENSIDKAFSYTIYFNNENYLSIYECLFFADNDLILLISEWINILKDDIEKFIKIGVYSEIFENICNFNHIENKKEQNYIYLLKNKETDETKIGFTKNYKTRILSIISQGGLKSYEYFIFKGINAEIVEKKLHKIFKEKRKVGEWFYLNSQDINKIKYILIKKEGFIAISNKKLKFNQNK